MPSKRKLVQQYMRDQDRIEGLAVQKALLIGTRISLRLAASIRAGRDPRRDAKASKLYGELQDLLRWSMIVGDLVGRARSIATSKGDAPRFTFASTPPSIYRTAIDFTKSRLNLRKRDIERLASVWGDEAGGVIASLREAGNETIRRAIADATAKQLGTRAAKAFIADAVSRAGMSPTNPWRIETAYRTGTNMAYNAGRWEQWQDDDLAELLWGYEYASVGDNRVRPAHQALDGTRLKKDDARWGRIWPPNGYNCRCSTIEILSGDREARTKGPRKVDGRNPQPDEGFAFNPGRVFSGKVPLGG